MDQCYFIESEELCRFLGMGYYVVVIEGIECISLSLRLVCWIIFFRFRILSVKVDFMFIGLFLGICFIFIIICDFKVILKVFQVYIKVGIIEYFKFNLFERRVGRYKGYQIVFIKLREFLGRVFEYSQFFLGFFDS